MANELTIVKQENIQTIVKAAPQSYIDNKTSRERCEAAGNAILARINQQGMNDALDQEAAAFIEKAKKTVKVMNERRAPVTKLFDQIRAEFTSLENAIDPAKKDTVTAQLQLLRNQYAAKKREEEQRKLLEIQRKQQIEQARNTYRAELTEDYNRQYNAILGDAINSLNALDSGCTLDNYNETFNKIHDFNAKFPEALRSSARMPTHLLNVDECRAIAAEVLNQLLPKYKENYETEIVDYCNEILDRLPSKKANLERAAKASAEEAERIKAEMAAREAAEAAQREKERREREEKEKAAAEMAKQQTEITDLFNASAGAVAEYQPKTKVSKKINPLNVEAFPKIFMMWWLKEGCSLSIEELSKTFKKQITFCEKLANKDGEFIEDENIEYVDDVKAK